MDLSWLRVCAEGQTTGCIPTIQLLYLAALLVGVVLLAIIAVRSRDLSTATLALMPVAIAINIAVGAIVVALRLPIYLDSIGTVLVGVVAGPWAGALTGLLANLIWAILPVPGGAGPTTAFFAPVAAVIGLLAGFWAGRGAFRLRADDERIGGFLALAAGVAASGVALIVVQQAVGLSFDWEDLDSQMRFVILGLAIVAVGVAVGWMSGRTIFRLPAGDPRISRYLAVATSVSAGVLVFAILRLVFAPNGYFSTLTGSTKDGTPDGFLGGANLTGLAAPDPLGFWVVLAIGHRARAPGVELGTAGRARPDVPGLGRRADDRPGGGGDLGARSRPASSAASPAPASMRSWRSSGRSASTSCNRPSRRA